MAPPAGLTLSYAERTALASGSYYIAIFIRLAVAPVLRCWLGLGPIKPGVNTLDPDGVVYEGYGQALNVPAMKQLINGTAERIETGLSGLDNRILELATYANVVHGKTHDIGIGIMGPDWALLGSVHWVKHYVADYLTMSVTPAQDIEGETVKTATLSSRSLMTGRMRPNWSYFNFKDQHARSALVNPTLPPDRFCQRTPLYSVTGSKTWPDYS